MSIVKKNPFADIDIPWIPEPLAKMGFELAQLFMYDDRRDLQRLAYSNRILLPGNIKKNHDSNIHHHLFGPPMMLGSSIAGLIAKVGKMMNDFANEDMNSFDQDFAEFGNMANNIIQDSFNSVQQLVDQYKYQQQNYVGDFAQEPPVYMGYINNQQNQQTPQSWMPEPQGDPYAKRIIYDQQQQKALPDPNANINTKKEFKPAKLIPSA